MSNDLKIIGQNYTTSVNLPYDICYDNDKIDRLKTLKLEFLERPNTCSTLFLQLERVRIIQSYLEKPERESWHPKT